MADQTIDSSDNSAQPNVASDGDVSMNAGDDSGSTAAASGQTQQPADNKGADRAAIQGMQIKKYRSIIEKFGMSPDDDRLDQVAAGILSPQDLMSQFQQPQQPQNQATKAKTPVERMRDIQDRVNQHGATQEDFKELMAAVVEDRQQQMTKEQTLQQQQRVQEVFGATDAVLASDPTFAEAPDNIKNIEQRLFRAATDMKVASSIPPGVDPQTFMRADVYAHYAKQVLASDMAALRSYYAGRSQGQAGVASGQRPAVNPIGAADGGSPVQQPGTPLNFNKVSVADAMRNYNQRTTTGAV